MALLEVVLRGSYIAQVTVNKWNYVSSGTPTGVSLSLALLDAMGFIPDAGVYDSTKIFADILGLVNVATAFIDVEAKDIYSVTDFYTAPFVPVALGTIGTLSTGLPPFVAFGFRSNRVRSDVRRSTKRFAGVDEGAVEGGGGLSAGALTTMNSLAGKMSDTLVYTEGGNNLTFTPVTAGKQKYNPTPETQAYRYYPTLTEQLEHTAQGIVWQPYVIARSQVSRQQGHGN